jgi:hypothetical protein
VMRPATERVSKWEELVYTRQFSYEWHTRDRNQFFSTPVRNASVTSEAATLFS